MPPDGARRESKLGGAAQPLADLGQAAGREAERLSDERDERWEGLTLPGPVRSSVDIRHIDPSGTNNR
jgi:hypothetical protein